ncbi:1-aminocyclopropane-1-carboxylate synthase-like protein 1 [Glandiceps talaboti]
MASKKSRIDFGEEWLSQRGVKIHKNCDSHIQNSSDEKADITQPYDADTNPNGIVCLHVGPNSVSANLVVAKQSGRGLTFESNWTKKKQNVVLSVTLEGAGIGERIGWLRSSTKLVDRGSGYHSCKRIFLEVVLSLDMYQSLVLLIKRRRPPDLDAIGWIPERLCNKMFSKYDNYDYGEDWLSQRAVRFRKSFSVKATGDHKCTANPYHPVTNQDGVINLGISGNTLSSSIVAEKLEMITKNMKIEPQLLDYHDFRGMSELRSVIARFLTKYTKPNSALSPNNLTVLNGCSAVTAALGMVLFDPGDGLMVPTPLYNGMHNSMRRMPEVEMVYVDLDDNPEMPFQLTADKLESTFQEAEKQGIKVRGLFLINPHNPTGDIYPESLLRECLQFAKRHALHVIIDEIYLLSVFQEDTKFTSVLSLEDLPDPERTHVIWGFSKDFCMCGLRCGVLYSWNTHVIKGLSKVNTFFSVPTLVQSILHQMLQDEDWVEQTYIPANHCLLRESHEVLSNELTKLEVPHLKRSAGLFVWVNLKKFLPILSFAEELKLFHEFVENGVNISPGQSYYCSKPGWFRIVFAVPLDTLRVAIKRVAEVLENRKLTVNE